MNKTRLIILLIAALSILSGYLMSKASFVGRLGINLFYKQYKFLKVWWQGGLAVFIILVIFFLLQGWMQKKRVGKKAYRIHSITLVIALAGLLLTYLDFRNSINHRLLGERFHLGVYLFWIGWMIISIYYLVQPKPPQAIIQEDNIVSQ